MRKLLLGAACSLLLAGTAGAGTVGAQTLFEVIASNGQGMSSFVVTTNDVQPMPGGEGFQWSLGSPVEFSNGALLDTATFDYMSLMPTARGPAPQISLTFSVQAGGTPTNFLIQSGLLGLTPIANAQGLASAAITATDVNITPGNLTATVMGLGPGGNSYTAFANGSEFVGFIPSVVTAPFFSATENDNFGPAAIGGSANSMQAQFNFSLTAGDTASGTSNYLIIPEPTTLSLLGLGALGLLRRR